MSIRRRFGSLGLGMGLGGGGIRLGSEKWLSDASTFVSGTYTWISWGTNTIGNVDNSLEVTYVDNGNGAYSQLRVTLGDIDSDLTVGATYVLSADYKVSSGACSPRVYDGSGFNVGVEINSTEFVRQTITFTAASAILGYLTFLDLSLGEKVYIDNLSLKEVL